MKYFSAFFILLLIAPWNPALAAAETTRVIDDFSNGISPLWKEKKFSGQTRYEFATESGKSCIRAISDSAASGLFYEIEYDLNKYPYISWSWFVKNTIAEGDARLKAGDDYAARIYIVFPSLLPWRTRAINYIWANHLPQGTLLPNAYTKNDMMFAVESGNGKTGRWVQEQRNILEDFKKAFNEKPPEAGAIAIMTDTDNTGSKAEACYGPIIISASPLKNDPDNTTTCTPTPPDVIGPFYRPGAPMRNKTGEGYTLRGTVRNAADCRPVPNARIEFWSTGPDGNYDSDHRATLITDGSGTYSLETDYPPPYSGRPSHVHTLVTAPGFERLITQHYPGAQEKSGYMDLVLIPLSK